MSEVAVAVWADVSRPVAERVEALLAQLTIEEKAGQLGSFWPRPDPTIGSDIAPGRESRADEQAGSDGADPVDGAVGGDVAPLQSVLQSSRGLDQAAADGLGHLTRVFGSEPIRSAEGVAKLRSLQRRVVELSRLGIPAIAHEECLTGFTAYGATVYPAAIAWGATFDPALIEEMGHAIGTDLAASGIHQGLAPLLDVVRDYRWGRVEETTGEDPYLVGTLGTAYVRGLQRAGVIATLKHFCGYSAARAGRNHAPVPMGPREFVDIMLPPFEMAVREGGARSVMNSYSDVDGLPVAADRHLLTEVLRDQWGFTGTVVSDYWSVTFLQTMHRVVPDLTGAGVAALVAGLDVELPETGAYGHLADAVRDGRLDECVLDEAVRRVLTHKVELGLLDPDFDADQQGTPLDLDSPRNRDLARRVAEESVVLCRNDGVLPLSPAGTVALVGPTADQVRSFMGCYAFPNHVLARLSERDNGLPGDSLAAALAGELDGAQVSVHQGVPVQADDRSGLAEAVAAASDADVAVVAVGDLAGLFGGGTSGEGCDSVDLRLPGLQAELIEQVLDTGTPVVLVVVSGRPYSLGAFAERCAAVVQAFMPGIEGGAAIAGVLSGRINPSGKLPIGIPDHPGGQPGTYLAPPLGWYSHGVSNLDPRPLYPFGHGLSYTTFALDDYRVDAEEVGTDGTVEVRVRVRNTGTRAGSEVVQLYAEDPVAQVARPLKQLIGYARVSLDPGTAAEVAFEVHSDRLAYTGRDLRRIVEPGEIVLSVGTSSEDRPLGGSIRLDGPVREVLPGRGVLTTPVRVIQED